MAGFDNRSGFTFGDTVLAPYALPDQKTAEAQPCTIVSSVSYNQQRGEVLIMAIAYPDRPNASSGEMALQLPGAAGLDKGAALKPMLMTVEQRLVRVILGRLDIRDRESLRQLMDLIVGA